MVTDPPPVFDKSSSGMHGRDLDRAGRPPTRGRRIYQVPVPLIVRLDLGGPENYPARTTRCRRDRSLCEGGVNGLVFDFGNVLYRVDYEAMARALAGQRSAAFLARFVGSPEQVAYETGRATLDEVITALGEAGFPVTRGHFLDAYLDIFEPIPGSRALVAALAEVVPLGLLSNTSPEHARLFIEKTPEFPLFRASAYSFEIGWMKPDLRTYREIARRLGRAPQDLVYVDDIVDFARAADAVGMKGIPFRGAAGLSRELAALGFPTVSNRRA